MVRREASAQSTGVRYPALFDRDDAMAEEFEGWRALLRAPEIYEKNAFVHAFQTSDTAVFKKTWQHDNTAKRGDWVVAGTVGDVYAVGNAEFVRNYVKVAGRSSLYRKPGLVRAWSFAAAPPPLSNRKKEELNLYDAGAAFVAGDYIFETMDHRTCEIRRQVDFLKTYCPVAPFELINIDYNSEQIAPSSLDDGRGGGAAARAKHACTVHKRRGRSKEECKGGGDTAEMRGGGRGGGVGGVGEDGGERKDTDKDKEGGGEGAAHSHSLPVATKMREDWVLAPERYLDFFFGSRPEWSDQNNYDAELGRYGDGVRFVLLSSLRKVDKEMMLRLAVKYKLHPLAVEDVLGTEERPKVDTYGSNFFVNFNLFEWVPQRTDKQGDFNAIKYGIGYSQISVFVAGTESEGDKAREEVSMTLHGSNVALRSMTKHAGMREPTHHNPRDGRTSPGLGPGMHAEEGRQEDKPGKDTIICVHKRRLDWVGKDSGWEKYSQTLAIEHAARAEAKGCCGGGGERRRRHVSNVTKSLADEALEVEAGSAGLADQFASSELWDKVVQQLRHTGTRLRDSRADHLLYVIIDLAVDQLTPIIRNLRAEINGIHTDLLRTRHAFKQADKLSYMKVREEEEGGGGGGKLGVR